MTDIEREEAVRQVYEDQRKLAWAWSKLSRSAKLLLLVLHPLDFIYAWSYVRLWWLLRRFV
jgi:hypothetical protein